MTTLFTFNPNGILSTMVTDQEIPLSEKLVNWETPEDVIIGFNSSTPLDGFPFSFIEYPDGSTKAIYDIDDTRNYVVDAPIDTVYYIYPDTVTKEILLWVRKEDGWHQGAVYFNSNETRRTTDKVASVSSSELFDTIKGTNANRKPFTIFYYLRDSKGAKLCEKLIREYIDLVDIIFNQDVIGIKYFVNGEHKPLMVTYSRSERDGWKRLI